MSHPGDLAQALTHLADDLLAGREIDFSEGVQEWSRRGFRCAEVPPPTDADPLRVALKACIVERLVEVLNSPPHDDDQSAPTWTEGVPAIPARMPLQSGRLLEGEVFNGIFEKRNFLVTRNFMYFI